MLLGKLIPEQKNGGKTMRRRKKRKSPDIPVRATILFLGMALCFGALIVRLYGIGNGKNLAQAANAQRSCTLQVAQTRGTIYDCKFRPITNGSIRKMTVASATPQSVLAIQAAFPAVEAQQILERLKNGKPTVLSGTLPDHTDGAVTFTVPQTDRETFCAPHVVGYTNGDGVGVCGIEQAYDGLLKACGGAVSVNYQADAWGRVLTGESLAIDSAVGNPGGVVLTIDREIQQMAEQVAAEQLPAGAIVVLESATGKIRAMVSSPTYSPENVEEALNSTGAPLLNRALSAYNVGSVFKLVGACCAVEEGETNGLQLCTGTLDYGGRRFQCIGATAHGEMDLTGAVANSCNCYFISLADRLGGNSLYRMAKRMGLGEELWLTTTLRSEAGTLPALQDLSAPAALANFSFGQGALLATPLQIAGLIQVIANDGQRIEPSLIECTIDENGQCSLPQALYRERILTAHSAQLVRKYMIAAVENGSAFRAMPANGGAGAKTATAETGWYIQDTAVIQAWCAGFYPAETAEYVIVVFAENGQSGSGAAAPVFQQIADGLWNLGVIHR